MVLYHKTNFQANGWQNQVVVDVTCWESANLQSKTSTSSTLNTTLSLWKPSIMLRGWEGIWHGCVFATVNEIIFFKVQPTLIIGNSRGLDHAWAARDCNLLMLWSSPSTFWTPKFSLITTICFESDKHKWKPLDQ